jgi:hypothetical protein
MDKHDELLHYFLRKPAPDLSDIVRRTLDCHRDRLLVNYLPNTAGRWVAENLKNALVINVFLAIFNLLPLPPLDGERLAYFQIEWQNRSPVWNHMDCRSS